MRKSTYHVNQLQLGDVFIFRLHAPSRNTAEVGGLEVTGRVFGKKMENRQFNVVKGLTF